ncbi:MAG TPA: flagellar protein FlbD [Lachnoclostridium phytofermentans]|uniref:Flagellar protein FlbD n=2 Tax=Lachnoclostridium TaxID=1506553 RepID=A0A3D2X9S8_9FIRM|nr:flagellar FlbD family protein [Lachnoclostridium sp.]HCL03353.1 flagellar protein FlbD [Lachnoclostridium phytofermentans]
MINLTRLNDIPFTLNCELIEIIEEVPDTVITLVNGKKIFVKESRQSVVNLVKLYKKEVLCQTIPGNDK